jgi:hypothetical protein
MEHHWITERKMSSIDPSNHAMQEKKSWTLAKLYDMAHITSDMLVHTLTSDHQPGNQD